MNVELTDIDATEVEADVLALAAGGLRVRELDALFDGRLRRAAADAEPVAVVPVTSELRARRVVLVALDESEPDDLQTAAARAVRAQRAAGGTIAWALDESVPLALYRQVRAVVEGAVLGGYDAGRWKSDPRAAAV